MNNIHPNRWIDRGGRVPWPPRSPDLNPLDFFFWGYSKNIVYDNASITDHQIRHDE